jgi:hypothetical protein
MDVAAVMTIPFLGKILRLNGTLMTPGDHFNEGKAYLGKGR